MPIYTRKGDQGRTSLGDGTKVGKTHLRVEAVGALDELNSAIGLAVSLLPPTSAVRTELVGIQHRLFTIGAHLALPKGQPKGFQEHLPIFPADSPEAMEKAIDRWWKELPALKNFILPGGTPAGAAIHLARAISRRAERVVVRLASARRRSRQPIDPKILAWLNRLSDFLFAAGRTANHEQGVTDTLWQK